MVSTTEEFSHDHLTPVKILKAAHEDDPVKTKQEEQAKTDGVEDTQKSGSDSNHNILEEHDVGKPVEGTTVECVCVCVRVCVCVCMCACMHACVGH